MDEQDRAIYVRVVDAVAKLTHAVTTFELAANEMTSAVATLAGEVAKLRRDGDASPAE